MFLFAAPAFADECGCTVQHTPTVHWVQHQQLQTYTYTVQVPMWAYRTVTVAVPVVDCTCGHVTYQERTQQERYTYYVTEERQGTRYVTLWAQELG
jgi:hypothetical protein